MIKIKLKIHQLSILLLMIGFSVGSLYGQNYVPTYLKTSNEFINTNLEVVDSSGWFNALPNLEIPFINFWDNHKQDFGLDTNDNLILVRTKTDNYPFIKESDRLTHSRFNQTYKGLKVEYAEIFLHHKDNKVTIINGKLAEGLNIDINPTLSESDALTKAINYLGADNLYSWQDTAYETAYKGELDDSTTTSYPNGELLIAKKSATPDYSASQFVIAWKFRVLSLNPRIDVNIYINAHTGAIIKEISNIQEGTADLSYGYGTGVYIDTRWRGFWYQHYVLRSDDVNAPSIWVKEARYNWFGDLKRFGGYNVNNSFDHDDQWHTNRAAETTPFWVATKTWNYYKATFGLNGYDDNGSEVKIYADCDMENAFWSSGEGYLAFGKHNGNHLGTKDIVGHEYTHAVISNNANLVYQNESGALNESFADIFGYEVERYLDGASANWTMGEDASFIIRNMSYPNQYGQPAVYHGSYWYSGSLDQGGVHTNSGVQNYWFYLLTEGSNGALNGTYNNIAVDGISADKARNIAFYSLDNFLGSNSNYQDAKNGSAFAAFVLYGLCSNERKQTINAWAAVGIGQPITPLTITGPNLILFSNNSAPSVPVNVIASGGRQDVRYKWTYSGPWSYSILPYMGDRHKFEISNFNNAYNTTTISVNDDCDTKGKTIYFINRDNVIILHPNPVIGDLHVEVRLNEISEKNPIGVSIIDAQGNLEYQGTQTTSQFVIDVSNLSFGNHFLQINQGELNLSKQFLKN